jgi:23S rRNA U2552 (ribose-2'-O)-methylase RlmE/FtsJ
MLEEAELRPLFDHVWHCLSPHHEVVRIQAGPGHWSQAMFELALRGTRLFFDLAEAYKQSVVGPHWSPLYAEPGVAEAYRGIHSFDISTLAQE